MKGKLSVGKKVLIAIFAVLALFSLIAGICLPKLTNSAFADGTETVYPAYTALKITQNSYTFRTDDSSDSMKAGKAFTVEGSVDGTTYEEITDKTLYEFVIDNPEKNGRFSTVNPNTVYARYLHAAEGTEVTSNSVTVWSVQKVTPKSVRIEVADGWSLSEGYYRQTVTKGDKSYQISAFVDTMSQQSVFEHLKVVAVYERSELEVVFDYNNNVISGIKTGETFGSATSSFTTGNNSVEVTVDGITGTATLPFEARRVVSIDLDRENWTQPTELTSASPTSALNFSGGYGSYKYIVPTYNTGVSNAQDQVSFEVEGILTPTGKDIAAALAQESGDYLYNRTVSIKYTGGSESDRSIVEPIEVTITGIQYVAPEEIDIRRWNVEPGSPVRQTAQSEFNYDGINLQFYYGEETVYVPLNDLKDAEDAEVVKVEYTYKNGKTGTTLTRQVDKATVTVKFDYKASDGTKASYSSSKTFQGLTIDPVRLAVPGLKEGYGLITYVPPTAGKSNTFKTLELDEKISADSVNVSASEEGASYDSTTGEISFSKAGTFHVEVRLTEGEAGDYAWDYDSSVGGGTIALKPDDSYTLIYTIQVDRADIVLDLAYTSIDRTYGWKEETDSEIGATVTAKLKDDPNTAIETIGTNPVYKFWYYTSSTGISNATETKPKDVGNYFVFVRTVDESSELYKPAETAPQSFAIEPKELTTDITKDVPYDGNAHQISEFIDKDKNVFAYDDDFSKVFIFNNTPTDTGKDGNKGYVHVNPATDYSATLKLNSSNYKWAGETAASATVHFNLTKKRLDIKTTATGFTYGDADANPNARVSDEAKGFITFSDKKSYYKGTTLKEDTTSFSEWDAGDYTACFPWQFAGEYVNANDIELYVNNAAADLSDQAKSVSASFAIGKASLARLSFDQSRNLGKYKDAVYSIAFGNWASMLSGLKNGDDVKNILGITVTGTLADGTSAAERITNNYDGTVGVIDAGSYSISIAFLAANNNYQWVDGTRDEVVTAEGDLFTVERKELSFKATDGKNEYSPNGILYTFDGEMHVPSIVPVTGIAALDWVFADGVFSGGKLSVKTFAITGSTVGTVTDPTAADTYKITVSAFAGEKIDGAAYNYDVNFVLPADATITFTINSSALKIPTLDSSVDGVSGDNVRVEYKGAAYIFKEYLNKTGIANFEAYFNSIVVDGADNLKDVKFDGSHNVTSYTITVTPATNYKWDTSVENEENKTYTFTFTITQKEIDVNWNSIAGNLSKEYSGDSQLPVAVVADGFVYKDAGDEVLLSVNFGATALTDVKNAGTYTAYAAIDTENSTGGGNYKLSADNSTRSATFEITKKKLDTPQMSGSGDEFTGSSLTRTYTIGGVAEGDSVWSLVTFSATHTLPDKFTGTNTLGAESFAGGVFTFVNAGTYSVTFTLTASAGVNYYFTDKEATQDKITVADFVIGRMNVVAPELGDERALEWEDDKEKKPLFAAYYADGNYKLTQNGHEVLFSVAYGSFTGEPRTYTLFAEGKTSTAVSNNYFARVTFVSDTAYNYQWLKNDSDTKGLNLIGNFYGEAEEGTQGIAYNLVYGITLNQLKNFSFKVTDYTFGDNGKDVNGIVKIGLGDVFALVAVGKTEDELSVGNASIATINSIIAEGLIKIDYTFTRSDEVSFIYSNNLPWQAGQYDVKITISFLGKYEDLYARVDFTVENLQFTGNQKYLNVAQREITAADVTFTNTDAVTYDGNTHTVTATYNKTFTPVVNDVEGEPSNIALIMSSVTNAGENQTLTVERLDGADKDNFVVSATSAPTQMLTVNKRAVTIFGKVKDGVANSLTYGDTIDFTKFEWAYGTGSNEFVDDDKAGLNLTLTLVGYTAGSYLAANKEGEEGYVIKVTYTANDNYTITVETPNRFIINPREITVTLKDDVGSQYGAAVNLYADSVITVTNKAENDALKDVIVMDAKLNNVSASATAPVGDYVVSCDLAAKNKGNYTLVFNGESGDKVYVLSNATFTIVQPEDFSAEYKFGDYHVLSSQPDTTSARGTEKIAANGLTFYLSKAEANEEKAPAFTAEGRWTKYNELTVKNVADSGKYWILATAKNHDDATSSMQVTISKKEVTVKLDFSILYGEEKPETAGYLLGEGQLAHLDDSKFFTLGGVCDGDTVAYDEGSSFAYTTNYTYKDVAGGNYTVTLNLDSLTASNYSFKAVEGKLTVNKFEITVNIANPKATVYNVTDATRNKLGYTISYPTPTYGAAAFIALPDADESVFTLSTTAFVNSTATNSVGTYPIVGDVVTGADTNYTVTFAGSWNSEGDNSKYNDVAGVYTISAAEIVANFTGLNAEYNEHAQALVKRDSVTTVGTNDPTVVYYYTTDAWANDEASWNALDSTKYSEAIPELTDVWSGTVYIRIVAGNHETKYMSVSAEISQATNELDKDFAYDGSAMKWVYGYGGDGGFSQSKVTNPEVKFTKAFGSDAKTPIKVAVNRVDDTGKVIDSITDKTYTDGLISVALLLEEVFNGTSGKTFTAGKYVLTVTMDATNNYTALNSSFDFTVEQRNLTVKAEDQEIVYGNDAKTFVAAPEGLVANVRGGAVETLNVVFGKDVVFTTNYKVGDRAGGTYTIVVDSETKYTTDNYAVTFAPAKLTVDKRPVTVVIADKENHYNLKNDAGAETLTFTLKGEGTFYIGTESVKGDAEAAEEYNNTNQWVIELKTEALTNSNSAIKTNNVKLDKNGKNVGYPIYAVWRNHAKGYSYAENYEITIEVEKAESRKTVTTDGAIGTKDNAATFMILPAVMDINLPTNPTNTIYNGEAKVYEASVVGDSGVTIKSYYEGLEADGTTVYAKTDRAPTNAGSYTVTFSAVSDNYIVPGSFNLPIKIDKATVTVTPVNANWRTEGETAWIQYGTPIPDNYAASTLFSGFAVKYTLKFGDNNVVDDIDAVRAFIDNEINKEYWDRDAVVKFDTTSYDAKTSVTPEDSPRSIAYASGLENARNFTVETSSQLSQGKLRVIPRKITLTVKGFDADRKPLAGLANDLVKVTYKADSYQSYLTEELANAPEKFFKPSDGWNGSSGDSLADLKLTLNNNNATNYGVYKMTAGAASASNYDITYVQDAYFVIEKAPLKVYAQVTDVDSRGQNYVSGNFHDATSAYPNGCYKAEHYSAVYGNSVGFEIGFDGFLNNQTFEGLKQANGMVLGTGYRYTTAYNQDNVWANNVGEYSVLYGGAASDNAGELEFLNYEITYVPTLFTVTQRTVSASVVENNEYTEAESGYHNGEWGATLDAEIRFANAGNGLSALNPNYLPGVGTAAYQYTRTYSGAAGTTPNKVGAYNVTLAFHTTSNYKFADGAEVTLTNAYQITPKSIALAWGPTASIPDFDKITDKNEKVRTISEYVGEIMEFASEGFSRVTDNGGSSSTETVPTTAYTLKNDGLAFTAYGAGTYILVIQLKSSARNNYTLNGAAENGKVTLTLVVSSNSVTLVITDMKGWTYRETANTPTVTVDSSTPATNVPFTYARLGSNADYAKIDAEKYKGQSLNTLEGLSVNDSHFNANVPVNAGGYIVRAYWQATGQYAYRLFEILPMTVTSPALNVIESGVDRNDTFNGNTLVMEIARQEGVVVTANNGCNVMPSGSSVRLEAMNARTYNIVFSLESENYVWSGSETAESDGTVVKTWTVNKGQDTINDLTVTGTLVYGDTFDASATSAFGGRITYLYQEAQEGKVPEDVGSGWILKSQIQDAKTYWVKATTQDTANYLGGVAYYTFTIAKATLTVTPYATITYGDTFRTEGGAGYRYEVSGFLRGDNNSVISGNVTYSVPADANLHVTDEGVVLTVDVSGLSALNYTFETAEGKLTVGKKSIVVSIGNAEAYYSVEISVADVKLTVADNALVSGDTVDKLNITLKVVDALGNSVSKGADVGSYSIVCDSSDAADYALNFNSGIFTVKALPVVVSLGANGGAYDGNAKEAEVISVVCNVTGYDQEIVASELTSKLAFNYTGVTMGGVAYNSDKAPADAGSYMASVTGVSANFTLLTTPSISFTISKKVINEGDIKIASQEYDGGKSLVPDISETADYTVAIGNYTVAGTHQVILTLKHANNTQWKGTTQDFCTVDFVVTPANNVATKPLAIEGWTFGSAANAPEFAAKYESAYTYRYYDADGNLLDGVPTNAGTYSVTVSAAGTSNWNALPESTRVTFTIAKQTLNAPKVVIVADGEEKNDTYTGGELRIRVTGYDHLLMGMTYAGNSVVNGNEVTLVAVNAGDYAVTFSLADSANYAWASALGVEVDSAGGATLGWKINRKKVNKPKPGNNKLIVNGKVLTYLPEGFDPEIMKIEGNEAGYGGSFTASVELIDPNNYEWAEGGNTVAEAYPFRIVGANTVFIAVICSLSGVAVIAAGAAITQAVMHKRKKRLAEESMDEIDRLSGDTPNGPSNGAADGTASDAPAEATGEAQSANVGGNE